MNSAKAIKMYMTSRAAQYCLAGRMRPVGRGLESPVLEHCKKFLRFSNFTLLIQKNGKFWSVCTVFDRKRKNTENGKSTKRNLNFVKQRNGSLTVFIPISALGA